MREFVKSTVSLPWALSLFGVEQLTNILIPQNSGRATAAFDAVTLATGGQLAELVQGLYLLGDTLQRDMTDWAFRMLTPEVFNPWSDVNSELWQESAEIWRNLIPCRALGLPGGNCRIRRRCLTWCAIFQPRCNFPKCRHTRHCLKRSGGPMPWTNTLRCGPWKG